MFHPLKNIIMKKLFALLLLIVGVDLAYSQNYDLIVNTKGDSIACRIDSIINSNFYFKMKVRNYWVNTNIDRNEVVVHKYNAIDQNAFIFKEGTSYIEKKLDTGTKHDTPKNSLYLSTHILTIDAFYERTIPLRNKLGLIAGAGIIQEIGFSDATNPAGKIGCLLGGSKHYFEAGIVIAPRGQDIINILLPLVGYRYQNPKGFLFRVDLMLFSDSGTAKDGSGDKWFEVYPIPGIAFGYSF